MTMSRAISFINNRLGNGKQENLKRIKNYHTAKLAIYFGPSYYKWNMSPFQTFGNYRWVAGMVTK